MTANKISAEEISDLKISSLPTHPTAPRAYGGKGYTASEMKAAFDRLPLFIIERFNALIDDIQKEGEGSLADSILTGIEDAHTLSDLFSDISSGELASYLSVDDASLLQSLTELKEAVAAQQTAIDEMEERIENINTVLERISDAADTLGSQIEAHEARISALEAERGEADE